MQAIADMSFKFAAEDSPQDFVTELSANMFDYRSKYYITGPKLYYQYSPEEIHMILDKLTPDKVNILVTSKDPPEHLKFDKKERWFGTEYTDQEIPKNCIKEWKNVQPYSELALPEKNPFITKNFSLLANLENHPKYPKKILDTTQIELWYRQDQTFKLPLAYYYIYIVSPLSTQTAKNNCMLDALISILKIDIAEELYPAVVAQMGYEFNVYGQGFFIKVYGFNEKLPLMINVIAKHLKNLSYRISEDMFLAIKENLLNNYYNNLIDPSELAYDIRLDLIASEQWTSAEKYSATLDLNFADIKQFIQEYFKVLKLKTLVQGNVTPDIASKTITEMVSTLGFKELDNSKYPRFNVVQVSKGERVCRVRNFNTKDSNSIVTNYYQSGPETLKSSVILQIIVMIIEEPLFDILRTKEQLGSDVYISLTYTYGILGYMVTVNSQATKEQTSYVEERIENFMKYTQTLLANMDEKEFNKYKTNLIKSQYRADVDLGEEVEKNWFEIITKNYIFDRQPKEIELIGKTTLKEVRDWWDAHNAFANKENFRKLSIQVVGYNKTEIMNNEDFIRPEKKITIECLTNDSKKENKGNHYFIGNIDKYRTSQKIWKQE